MDALREVGIGLVAAQILEGKNGDALLGNQNRALASRLPREESMGSSSVILAGKRSKN